MRFSFFFLNRVSACLPGLMQRARLLTGSGRFRPRSRHIHVPGTRKLGTQPGRTTKPSPGSRPSSQPLPERGKHAGCPAGQSLTPLLDHLLRISRGTRQTQVVPAQRLRSGPASSECRREVAVPGIRGHPSRCLRSTDAPQHARHQHTHLGQRVNAPALGYWS